MKIEVDEFSRANSLLYSIVRRIISSNMDRDFIQELKPYRELDQATQRVLDVLFAEQYLTGVPFPGASLRFKASVSAKELGWIAEKRLVAQSSDHYRITATGLLYAPQAKADLEALDRLVRLAYARYRPNCPPLEQEELLRGAETDVATLKRLLSVAEDVGLPVGHSPARAPEIEERPPRFQLELWEQARETPDLATAIARRLPQDARPMPSPRPAAFSARPRRLIARNFRALRALDLELGPLTVLVGPNGSGKSTVLDALGFFDLAVSEGLAEAIQSQGGLPRLHTQGTRGPVELVLELELDYGRAEPVAARYAMTFDDLHGRLVVGAERLSVQSQSGETIDYVDAVKGHAYLRKADGGRAESIVGAGTLVLSQLTEHSQESLALPTDLRAALSSVLLIDRDPSSVPTWRNELLPPGFVARRRVNSLAGSIVAPVAEDAELVEKLAPLLRQLLPGVDGVRRIVVTGEPAALEIVEKHGLAMRVDELSAGARQLLLLLCIYLLPQPPTLLLIEEPDATVHPGSHPALLDLLRSISRRCPVVATTHSPSFIGLLDAGREVVALERDEEGTHAQPLAQALESHGWLKELAGSEAYLGFSMERRR